MQRQLSLEIEHYLALKLDWDAVPWPGANTDVLAEPFNGFLKAGVSAIVNIQG